MIAPSDIEKRREEIRQLISDASIENALKRLLDFSRDFSPNDSENLNESLVINANFRTLLAAENGHRVTFREARDERARLLHQSLELLDSIVTEQIGLAA